MVAEITVGEPEHQPVADSIQITGRGHSGLGHAGTRSWTERSITSRCRSRKSSKSGVSRRREVGVKMIGRVVRVTGLSRKSNKRGGRAIGGQGRTIEISRQKWVDRSA